MQSLANFIHHYTGPVTAAVIVLIMLLCFTVLRDIHNCDELSRQHWLNYKSKGTLWRKPIGDISKELSATFGSISRRLGFILVAVMAMVVWMLFLTIVK